MPIEAVYFEPHAMERPACAAALARAAASGVRLIELRDGVLERATDAVTPQPVVAVASIPPTSLSAVPAGGFVLVLLRVRDPGNLGTAIRSADASGATAVVVAGESVDVFNPKALRATAGSVFHLPVVVADTLDESLAALRSSGRRVLGAVVEGGTPLWSTPLGGDIAVVVGSEATGLERAEREALDGEVTIEMAGRAESLNVGVASALVCFEALRQRAGAEGTPGVRPTI